MIPLILHINVRADVAGANCFNHPIQRRESARMLGSRKPLRASSNFALTPSRHEIAARFGCPTWIRTMTRRVKVACATITPSGSDEWKGHAAAARTAVKAGKFPRENPPLFPPLSPADPRSLLQQLQHTRFLLLQLLHRTLSGRFVGAPAQEACAVSETTAGHVIEGNFHNEFGFQRLPFG